MLRLTNLTNVYKRRTLRVLYGNTQAYPYAATLSSGLSRTSGGQIGVTGSKAVVNPGSVAVKMVGEVVTLAQAESTQGAAERAFGLFANFIGGELDELGGASEVGVWRGPGSVYEVLAPAFDSSGLSTAAGLEAGTDATEVYMNASSTGVLVYDSSARGAASSAPLIASHRGVVRLISYLSANAIIVECLV